MKVLRNFLLALVIIFMVDWVHHLHTVNESTAESLQLYVDVFLDGEGVGEARMEEYYISEFHINDLQEYASKASYNPSLVSLIQIDHRLALRHLSLKEPSYMQADGDSRKVLHEAELIALLKGYIALPRPATSRFVCEAIRSNLYGHFVSDNVLDTVMPAMTWGPIRRAKCYIPLWFNVRAMWSEAVA